MILLDASVLIELIEQKPSAGKVLERLRGYQFSQLHVCAVTVFEVECGFWPGGHKINERRKRWRDFYRSGIVPELLYDSIADSAAAVWHQTAAIGRQIGRFEAIVAATALQEGLTVAARDKGFDAVRGLKYERWF